MEWPVLSEGEKEFGTALGLAHNLAPGPSLSFKEEAGAVVFGAEANQAARCGHG
jgi:hypothetical protein